MVWRRYFLWLSSRGYNVAGIQQVSFTCTDPVFCLAMNAAHTKADTTLMLATGLGLLLVRLYNGSMHDWSLNGLPVRKFHLEQLKTGQRD